MLYSLKHQRGKIHGLNRKRIESLIQRNRELDTKSQEGLLDIAVAEVNGIWSWETEAMVVAYMEEKASAPFWEWLQGFQVKLELKDEVTQSFCHLKPRTAIMQEGDKLLGLGAAIIAI
jgi:hypothetical protein